PPLAPAPPSGCRSCHAIRSWHKVQSHIAHHKRVSILNWGTHLGECTLSVEVPGARWRVEITDDPVSVVQVQLRVQWRHRVGWVVDRDQLCVLWQLLAVIARAYHYLFNRYWHWRAAVDAQLRSNLHVRSTRPAGCSPRKYC